MDGGPSRGVTSFSTLPPLVWLHLEERAMVRRFGLAAVLALAVLAASPARTEAGPAKAVDLAAAKTNAAAAGKAWLALVDAERYAESWTRASALFRQKVTQGQWVAMAKGVRDGLGPLRERTFDSASYTEAGDGAMVITELGGESRGD